MSHTGERPRSTLVLSPPFPGEELFRWGKYDINSLKTAEPPPFGPAQPSPRRFGVGLRIQPTVVAPLFLADTKQAAAQSFPRRKPN